MADARELLLDIRGGHDIAVGQVAEIELHAGLETPIERHLVDCDRALALCSWSSGNDRARRDACRYASRSAGSTRSPSPRRRARHRPAHRRRRQGPGPSRDGRDTRSAAPSAAGRSRITSSPSSSHSRVSPFGSVIGFAPREVTLGKAGAALLGGTRGRAASDQVARTQVAPVARVMGQHLGQGPIHLVEPRGGSGGTGRRLAGAHPGGGVEGTRLRGSSRFHPRRDRARRQGKGADRDSSGR